MQDIMAKRAMSALSAVLEMKSNDNVLIVTDEKKKDIGNAFFFGAEKLGGKAKIYSLPGKNRPLTKIPKDLLPLIAKGNSIIINAFEGFAEETPFRIKLIKNEISTNARVGHCPGITTEMMTEGPMSADYIQLKKDTSKFMKLFEDAEEVHITAPGGTDITLDIEDRPFDTDVLIEPGTFGNLPAGEIWCAPVENRVNGVIVCDGSIGDVGQVTKPVRIEVKYGHVRALECDDDELLVKIWDLINLDEMSSVVGELGIGLNPKARITGNLLEDEKAFKTAHVAFGNNTEMPNGENNSSTHRDFLFYDPTIKVKYLDGSEKIVMKDGERIILD